MLEMPAICDQILAASAVSSACTGGKAQNAQNDATWITQLLKRALPIWYHLAYHGNVVHMSSSNDKDW